MRKVRKPPACTQCRKRKIGCDRAKPICGNCVKYNKPDCFYPDGPGKMVAVPSASGMSTHGNGQGSNHFSQGNGVNQKNVMIQTQYPIMQTSIETSNFSFNPSVDTAMRGPRPLATRIITPIIILLLVRIVVPLVVMFMETLL